MYYRNEDDALIHKGHRQRMRAKFSKHTPDIFDTYELLEMLLYHSIPYKDTNPLSKKLLARFGGLDGVLRASREELLTVPGVGERTADLIVALDKISGVMGSEILGEDSARLDDYEAVGEYLVSYFEEHRTANFAVMLLDNDMRLIDTVAYEDRDYNSASVNPRLFIELAVRANASVVITAQNKYLTVPVVLPADRETTKMISAALSDLHISHIEHYIVSAQSFSGTMSTITRTRLRSDSVDNFIESRRLSAGEGGEK